MPGSSKWASNLTIDLTSPHGSGSMIIAWSGSIAHTLFAVSSARSFQSRQSLPILAAYRFVHQIITPNRLVPFVSLGNMFPPLDKVVLKPLFLKNHAIWWFIASAKWCINQLRQVILLLCRLATFHLSVSILRSTNYRSGKVSIICWARKTVRMCKLPSDMIGIHSLPKVIKSSL